MTNKLTNKSFTNFVELDVNNRHPQKMVGFSINDFQKF